MRGLAKLAMRGPLIASLLIAVFALLALFFGPALLISGGLLGLVTLRQGALAGLRTLLVAGTLCAAAMVALNGRLGIAAMAIAAAWMPVWGACLTLHRTRQQGQAVVNIGICVMVYAALMRFANPDVNAFWRGRLTVLGELVEAEGGQFLSADQIQTYGNLMHTASVALLYIGFTGMLMLARGWQAQLYNPGGFGTEFRNFVLPRWVLPIGALAAACNTILNWVGAAGGLAQDAMIVLLLMFAVQGLAVLHAVCLAREMNRAWLGGVYLLLGLAPHVAIPILATTGIADVVVDFRRRVRPNAGG